MYPNFLLGEVSLHGWWYYFPFAFIVKTPIATLAAILCAAVFAFRKRRVTWSLICVVVPLILYLIAAMTSDFNHGLRHLLPIFPLMYVAVAVEFAHAMQRWSRVVKTIGGVLTIALLIEVLPAFPDYIAFFNVAAGGSRGGLALLGDSNLDWGQDLPLLAQWQRDHPNDRMYLSFFGAIDPALYGIRYTMLPTGYLAGEPLTPPDPSQIGALAISATHLQGIYVRQPWDRMYAEIRKWKPREVLGGSIYIYDFPPRDRPRN
jgi:hypothetical protein